MQQFNQELDDRLVKFQKNFELTFYSDPKIDSKKDDLIKIASSNGFFMRYSVEEPKNINAK